MRNFVVFAVMGIFLMFGAATDDVAAGEVEELRWEIQRLLVQIRGLESDNVVVEVLNEVPAFEHLVNPEWDNAPLVGVGDFIYYRPIIWDSVGQNNYVLPYGLYDHRNEFLLLGGGVKQVVVVFDNRIISIKRSADWFNASFSDPVAAIVGNAGISLFNAAHNPHNDVLDDVTIMPHDHIRHRGFHGFFPKTRHDMIVRLGNNLLGIIFPANRKIELHRQVRLMVVGRDGVSLHGYPEGTVPAGIDYKAVARTTTNALGYFLLSEIMRDITILSHEAEHANSQVLGAPSGHQGPVQSLLQRTQSLLSGAVTPKGKKLTTWGTLKQQ